MIPVSTIDAQRARQAVELCAQSYDATTISTDLAHVLITRQADAIMVTFRGSKSARDWITDFQFLRRKLLLGRWNSGLDFNVPQVQVHDGFADALDSVIEPLNDALFVPFVPSVPFYIYGHSLGGAMAMLYAFVLARTKPALNIAGVYTFGQPRVGDGHFRDAYNAMGIAGCTWRFVHENDIVPRIPPWLSGYRHAGNCFFQNSNGSSEINPALGTLMLSDGLGFYQAYRDQGKVAALLDPLSDHHIGQYLAWVSQLPIEPKTAKPTST